MRKKKKNNENNLTPRVKRRKSVITNDREIFQQCSYKNDYINYIEFVNKKELNFC